MYIYRYIYIYIHHRGSTERIYPNRIKCCEKICALVPLSIYPYIKKTDGNPMHEVIIRL